MMFEFALLIVCLVGVGFAAKYKGREIDGKKFEATDKGNGVISSGRLQRENNDYSNMQ